MKKQIAVIFKQKAIKQVARGYAFNYLIPNKIAEIATKGKLKHVTMLSNLSDQKENRRQEINLKTKNDLAKIQTIHLRKKCGNNQQIFGSISEQDIQNIIFSTTGQSIEKRQIVLKNIKQIGTYLCSILIKDELETLIKIRIIPSYI